YHYVFNEPPFRDRKFDRGLKFAERCCDADPDKRPDAWRLSNDIYGLIIKSKKENSDDNTWNTIYHNDVNRYHVSRRRLSPLSDFTLKVDLGEDGEE
ncbi:12527_t:CDS:2, partial [Ambispora leptoticha]